jgi:hypothetical protein
MKRPFNEESQLLRHYLLHTLAENEQEQVELRLLSEKEFSRCLTMAQHDLIDDYVAGRLLEHEQKRFRQYYVTTAERKHRLNFGIALDRYVSERVPARSPSRSEQLFGFLRDRPIQAVSAVVAVILVFGTAFFIRSALNRNTIDQKESLKQEFARVNGWHDTRPLSVLKLSTGDTPVLTLRHNVVRGDGSENDVEVTRSVTLFRLLLEVPPTPYKTYEATLQAVPSEDLASVSALESRSEGGAHFVVINIPAKPLTRGDYQLKLIGTREDGQAATVGIYPFRVTKR